MPERELTIDVEFENYLFGVPQQTDDQLDASLGLEGGAIDPVTVWKGKDILVDGHRRVRRCRALGLPQPTVREREFLNREDVFAWMDTYQAGRRNLNDLQLAVVTDRILKRDIQQHGTKYGSMQRVAAATGQDVRQVARMRDLGEAIASLPESVRKRIQSGQLTPTQQEVLALAQLPEMHILRIIRELDAGSITNIWEGVEGEGTPRPPKDAPFDPGASQERTEPFKTEAAPKPDIKLDKRDVKEFFKDAFAHLGRLKSVITDHRDLAVGLANKVLAKIEHIDSHLHDWKDNGDEE